MAVIYKTTAHASAGREGVVQTVDGFTVSLAFPKPGATHQDKNNPEQLFASAYAGCFSQAVRVVLQQHQLQLATQPIVGVSVELHDQDGLFHIKAGVELAITGVDQTTAQTVITAAHAMCPFSRLIKPENFLGLTLNGAKL
ncbi:Ohr family peroxiredoxin [Mycoplasmoides pneumoniae]|uniref:Organic hydroperoxide resistance protein-like n=4 Tax=Mycoplasmoides pneumoniae TaxID=2104 RepID=OHRL_MYCPN|nr:OsmC family protein [Mycoplasmoides pneumoniae]P75123.1 RecName: Full=Organic hydroperoxide resistance protein-like [Mycoplasmoides pneumoniae M129]AAB95822.1 conserved hypothetical protein [Mycoplasmoides pneumoniae M129]ADK86994.1 peroxiredoxin, Ohr family protein [Mycoplasmoides pneumoniae FH]AJR19093.1 organic hydroperoxide resistance protein [Mycoplasmoides pneumoniae M129-B7]ALA30532.1 organic hydroperoxide resistance protein [Mycoplasmoides pneumoniae PI 1428]ALA30829.1 organic hydr